MPTLRRPLLAAALLLAASTAGAQAPAPTDTAALRAEVARQTQYVALWRRQADGRLRIELDYYHLPERPMPVRKQ